MPKPSHVLLAFTLVFGGILFVVRPAARPEQPRRATGPVVMTNPSPDTREVQPVVLRGRVVDPMGQPLAGASVRIVPAAGGDVRAVLATGEDGSYEVQLRDSAPVDVTIAAEGLATAIERRFPVRRQDAVTVLGPEVPWSGEPDVAPWAGGAFAGEGFVKGEGTELISGALVVVEETGLSARSDEIGRFRIGLPGPCTLRITAEDGRVGRLELDAIPRRQGLLPVGDARVVPGAALEGVVTLPDGSVAAGASVHVVAQGHEGLDRWVTADAAGAFRVDGLLASERVLVTALPPAGATPAGGLATSLEATPGDTSVLHLRLAEEQPMRLQVVRGSGAPEASAHVYCEQLDGVRRGYGRADDQGFVELRGLAALADAPAFEVRRDASWTELRVLGFDAEALRLTVE